MSQLTGRNDAYLWNYKYHVLLARINAVAAAFKASVNRYSVQKNGNLMACSKVEFDR
jgi:hypothetical protein